MTHTVYHLHDDYSNCNGYADSCSKAEEYIQLAKQQGMSAIAFSNHGNIYDWVLKKQKCDKAGIKYIHGIEAYICKTLVDKDRGSHIGLYARNWAGVKELNSLVSKMDVNDGHRYYNPRFSLAELKATSPNIMVTTACLASPLNRWDNAAKAELIEWLAQNKDRCFLEIQYHPVSSQIAFNKELYAIHKRTGIPLIAGTDTHASSKYKLECRKVLQVSKDSFYGEEDEFDLSWKTCDELIEAFTAQDALPKDAYMQAIQNTNTFASMAEDFSLDKAFKYPNLYGDNVRKLWQNHIFAHLRHKIQIGAVDTAKLPEYKKRILEEFKVMCKMGMESFMLFMSELLAWCTENDIPYGAGRGSVCGSTIAYITDITDVDPVVWHTVFSRFCNEDRISLGDIDVDFAPEDREKVYQYIINRFTPEKTAYIAAFGTIKDRGCIDVLTKGLHYPDLDKVMDIKNTFEEIYTLYEKTIQEEVNLEELVEDGSLSSSTIDIGNHSVYITRVGNPKAAAALNKAKAQYDTLIQNNQDLFYYFKGLKGTIISKGNHPSGIIGSPITLQDNLGVFHKDGDANYPVSTCAMKAVDSLNYVKFDILGLVTVGIIKDAAKLAGQQYPKAYKVNWGDARVWDDMVQNQYGVFQFEGDYAHRLLSDFRPKTINHMSMVNAALRPSGKSYRDRLIAGEFNPNPSEEIDTLLEENNGFLIFQEDTIKFLTDICDFTGSAADTTRRAIGKKDAELLKEQLPKILAGYCKHSPKPKETAEAEAKQFIQIIQDSSEYQFGYNHSTAYSMNGYLCTLLRCYHTLEFVTAYLNRAKDISDVNNGTLLAKQYGIQVLPIQFGYSRDTYRMDKKSNTIYKGIASIKYCNGKIAEELYTLSKTQQYTDFCQLLSDIKTNTSVDARQLRALTTLGFFRQFGKNKRLLDIITLHDALFKRTQFKQADIEALGISHETMLHYTGKKTEKLYKSVDVQGLLQAMAKKIPDKALSVKQQIEKELQFLECILYQNPSLPATLFYVVESKTFSDATKPYLTLYCLRDGTTIKTKVVDGRLFQATPFKKGAVLNIKQFKQRCKRKPVNGKWVKTNEQEQILHEWEVY